MQTFLDQSHLGSEEERSLKEDWLGGRLWSTESKKAQQADIRASMMGLH